MNRFALCLLLKKNLLHCITETYSTSTQSPNNFIFPQGNKWTSRKPQLWIETFKLIKCYVKQAFSVIKENEVTLSHT